MYAESEGEKMIMTRTILRQGLATAPAMAVSMLCVLDSAAFAQEDAKEIVAAAVRQNGHVCDRPQSAEPDTQDTSAGEKAWILRCENAAFRVKFKGTAGANVEPLKE